MIIEGEGAVLGVNLQCPIITNRDFVVSLCGSAYSNRAVVWRGEWGGPGIHVLDGSPHASRRRGCFWHGFWHFSEFVPNSFQWGNDILIDDRFVCEKLTIFPYEIISLNSVSNWLSYDIVRFKIEVGVDAKCTRM